MTDEATTAAREAPSRPPASRLWVPVLLAGLLGGVGGFALTRAFPAAPKPVASAPQSEARPLADDLIAKLKAGKNDEFFAAIRPGFDKLDDKQFGEVRKGIVALRDKFAKEYGPAGDFEFSRETVLSPSLVQFAYVEKHPRGCVMCFLSCYNTPAGWQVLSFQYKPLEVAFSQVR